MSIQVLCLCFGLVIYLLLLSCTGSLWTLERPPDGKSWLTGKDPDAGKDWEGGDRGWGSWMASLTQWTWVEASSERWGRTGKPGVLQSMGSQRVRYDLVTEQQISPHFVTSLKLAMMGNQHMLQSHIPLRASLPAKCCSCPFSVNLQ